MNLALWRKSIREARWLLAGSLVLMFVGHWLRVWISSFFTQESVQGMLSFLPNFVEKMMPVSIAQLSTGAGRIALEYDDPVILLLVSVWGISRGSDAVAGELNRGTMEMLLAQPVTRLATLWTQATVTLAGAVLLAAAALAGTATGLATVTLNDPVEIRVFVPAALNLLSLTVFLAGISTMVSSASDIRSRTIGIVGSFYALSLIAKAIGLAAPGYHWLKYTSFFTPFEPQVLVSNATFAWSFSVRGERPFELGGLGYDCLLVGLGLAAYLAASVIFWRRDLPAPL
jgi:beta-exotoxin I transport system permease protein